MNRGSLRLARHRAWWEAGMYWGARLLVWAWVAALVFVMGMVLGGMLRGRPSPADPKEPRPLASTASLTAVN